MNHKYKPGIIARLTAMVMAVALILPTFSVVVSEPKPVSAAETGGQQDNGGNYSLSDPRMEAVSLTENIIGEVFANMANESLFVDSPEGNGKQVYSLEDYPIDHHERDWYGDSERVRDLSDGNYLVYRDSYLIISEEDSSNYEVLWSEDKSTAYVTPAISEEELDGKMGIVLLSDSVATDTVIVFGGTPAYYDDTLVVPVMETSKITVNQLFSDGQIAGSSISNKKRAVGAPVIPIVNWNTYPSGTNWSGELSNYGLGDFDAGYDFNIFEGRFGWWMQFGVYSDFDITTTGATDGMEYAEVASISIPVDIINVHMIYDLEVEFDENPINVKGRIESQMKYELSIFGAQIHDFTTIVDLQEFDPLNEADKDDEIHFFIGSAFAVNGSFLEFTIDFYFYTITIGPLLKLEQLSLGGNYFSAKFHKDEYEVPDPSADAVHMCLKEGAGGCWRIDWFEWMSQSIYFVIDLYYDSYTFDIHDSSQTGRTGVYHMSEAYSEGIKPGECPHLAYRLNVNVANRNGKVIPDADVTYEVVPRFCTGETTTDANGKAVLFIPTGDYEVTASVTSPVNPDSKSEHTVSLDKKAGVQSLTILLGIPVKHVYFDDAYDTENVTNWPEDMEFMPFFSNEVNLPSQVPEAEGSQFAGWNTEMYGNGTNYAPGTKITANDDITLWAQWTTELSRWYVMYDANGGTSAPPMQSFSIGSDGLVSEVLPEGEMTFKGWTPDLQTHEPVYQPGETIPYDSSKGVVVLHALWEISPIVRPINITFDANGVEGAVIPDDAWLTKGSWMQLASADAPLGSGYEFLGWDTNASAKNPTYKAGNTYYFSSDTAFYAIWKTEDDITLTFKDSLSDAVTGIPDPIHISPSMSPNVTIPSNIPEKSGRVFVGWNTKQNGSGTNYAPSSLITITEDTTLWAQWAIAGNSWYVVYDANGGTGAPDAQIITQGEDAEISSIIPKCDNMRFAGWTPSLETHDPIYQPGDTLAYDRSINYVVLYALWQISPIDEPIHITFSANGVKDAKVPSVIWTKPGSVVSLEGALAPVGSGYVFLGWDEDASAKNPAYLADASYEFDTSKDLYAIWTNEEVTTLTFKDATEGDAEGMPEAISILPEVSRNVVIPSRIPTKSGMVFTGWNTEPDGSGTKYAPGSQYVLTEDSILWAQWAIAGDSWYVVYNAKGGVSAPDTQIVPQGEDAVLSNEIPELEGMVFGGWLFNDGVDGDLYQPGDTFPYDSTRNVVVLYAVWMLSPVDRPVIISFDANGGLADTVPENISTAKEDAVQLPDEAPTWDPQHIFLGWSVDPKATEPEWNSGDVVKFDEDTTLYAIWLPDYKVTFGAGSTWMRNGTSAHRFIANGNLAYFTELRIDGKTVTDVDFSSGSTIADIKASFMNSLTDGTHTVTFVYFDGECSAEFYVKTASDPATGDATNIIFLLALLMISILGFAFLGRKLITTRR